MDVYVPENSESQAVASEAPQTAADLAAKPVPNARDLLREAAEKAIANEAADPKEEKPAETSEPKKDKKKEEPTEELKGVPKLAAAIRAREQAQRVREEAKGEREKILAEASKERAAIEQERLEIGRLKAEAESERQKIARLRTNPMEAIKELGWNPNDLVQGVIREGTPEWQALQKQRSELESIHDKIRQYDKLLEEQNKEREVYKHQQQEQLRTRAVEQFLSKIPEESPLRVLYDEADIVAKGDRLADAYREKAGKVATFDEIVEALEYEAEQRLAKLTGKASVSSGKSAPKGKQAGNGPRTLSSSASSERRSAPKAYSELKSPAEQRKALEEAVKEAMRST